MIAHEAGDEVVAVVVARLTAEREGDVRFLAGVLQKFRAQLFGEELVGIAIVDKQSGKSGAVLDQRHRIMPAPGLLVVAEIAAERLDAPRHAGGSDDRGKSAGRAVAIGMA